MAKKNPKKYYNICSKCGKKIDGLPFKCHRCHQTHCDVHRLPEDHNCESLKRYKEGNRERWRRGIKDTFGTPSYPKFNPPTSRPFKEKTKRKSKYNPPMEIKKKKSIKDFSKETFEAIGHWLKRRTHRYYNYSERFEYISPTLLKLIVSIVAFAIFYSNRQELNDINLWIIKLGSVLLLASLYFIIKYGYKVFEEIPDLFKWQKRWLRYLIIIIILSFLWQVYVHRDTALNPIFKVYNNTDFPAFFPLDLNWTTLVETDSIGNKVSNSNQNKITVPKINKPSSIKSPLAPDINILELEQEIHNSINEERRINGLRLLSWDEKLSEIARDHSKDMALNNYFEHTNLIGQEPTDRANAKGYSCYKDFGSYYMEGIAENIFQNNLYDSITYVYLVPIHEWSTQSEIAFSTVQGWMDSPRHRENILTSYYDKEGIGIAISSDDKVLITQNFC